MFPECKNCSSYFYNRKLMNPELVWYIVYSFQWHNGIHNQMKISSTLELYIQDLERVWETLNLLRIESQTTHTIVSVSLSRCNWDVWDVFTPTSQSLDEFYRERRHGNREESAMATEWKRSSAVFAVISFVINPLSRSTERWDER